MTQGAWTGVPTGAAGATVWSGEFGTAGTTYGAPAHAGGTTAATPAPAHPDEAEPAPGAPDDGYTPTERNLPVISTDEGDIPDPTLLDTPTPEPFGEGEGPLYVVGDVHGYLDELLDALRSVDLVDGAGQWTGGHARLWFLGDFTDRGPDGVGVLDLVMRLSAEAAAAGGYCKALLGNHEILLMGAKRFGETPVDSGAGTASFQAAWLLNGGQRGDMERLEEHHLQWMSRLDAMALADRHLLMHSDATCYLDFGATLAEVNDAVTEQVLHGGAEELWDLFRKLTRRFAFREEGSGTMAARDLLDAYGGDRVVHGHSPIPYLLGDLAAPGTGGGGDGLETDEDGVVKVTRPHVYADGLAVAMDGGVTMSGTLLITRLPLAGERLDTEAPPV